MTKQSTPPQLDPMGDAEIEATMVGKADQPHGEQIELVEYDPRWPGQFAGMAAEIRGALGKAALAVEHVGSTAVPGLVAKPVIDMILAVADSADEAAYLPPLEGAGYELRVREPDWFQHRMFKRRLSEANLHVFSEGCSEIARMLRFRDWLRASPEDLQLYAATKRNLARATWRYVQNYADAKTEVVGQIMARADAAAIVSGGAR